MSYVLVTVSRGIIDRVSFADDALTAAKALADYVKGMNAQDDDAAVFGPRGLVANAKSFLDENEEFIPNDQVMKEITEEEEKPIYIIGNPEHPLGFMVTGPDDPLGFADGAEAVSELGQMRASGGKHLRLYRVIPVENPVVTQKGLESYNEDSFVEDFPFQLVEEYVAR
jgi:hypothetical protein